MEETRWWSYTQRLIGDDTAQEAAARAGFDKSAFTRWKKGANADPVFVVKLARAYHANVLEALVEAGLISTDEAQLRQVAVGKRDVLDGLSDVELAEEILRRARAIEGVAPVVEGRFGGGPAARRYPLDAAALERPTSHHDEDAAFEEQP